MTGFSKAGKESLRSEQINKLIGLLLGLAFCSWNLSYKSCLLFPYSHSLELPDQSGLNIPLFNTFFKYLFAFMVRKMAERKDAGQRENSTKTL